MKTGEPSFCFKTQPKYVGKSLLRKITKVQLITRLVCRSVVFNRQLTDERLLTLRLISQEEKERICTPFTVVPRSNKLSKLLRLLSLRSRYLRNLNLIFFLKCPLRPCYALPMHYRTFLRLRTILGLNFAGLEPSYSLCYIELKRTEY